MLRVYSFYSIWIIGLYIACYIYGSLLSSREIQSRRLHNCMQPFIFFFFINTRWRGFMCDNVSNSWYIVERYITEVWRSISFIWAPLIESDNSWIVKFFLKGYHILVQIFGSGNICSYLRRNQWENIRNKISIKLLSNAYFV